MGFWKKVEQGISDFVGNIVPHKSARERRAEHEAVASQIDYYKQQKEAITAEATRTESEREVGKKKIAEKQIKSMKRAYRSPGFLEEASGDLGNKLG